MSCFRLILLGLLLVSTSSQASDNAMFDQGVEQLKDRSFAIKAQGVEAIAASGHPDAAKLLTHMLQGELFFRKQDQKLVIGSKDGRRYQITDDALVRISRYRQETRTQENQTQQPTAWPDPQRHRRTESQTIPTPVCACPGQPVAGASLTPNAVDVVRRATRQGIRLPP